MDLKKLVDSGILNWIQHF